MPAMCIAGGALRIAPPPVPQGGGACRRFCHVSLAGCTFTIVQIAMKVNTQIVQSVYML